MSFHINLDGDVGECDAQIRCPFGDFDTQHYITEAEARAAYEGAMGGESMDEAFTKSLRDEREKSRFFESKRKDASAYLRTPPEAERGYLVPASHFVDVRKGDTVLGGKITSTRTNKEERTRSFTVQSGGTTTTYAVPIDDGGDVIPAESVFVDEMSSENLAVREIQVSEQNMAVAANFILTDCKRKKMAFLPDEYFGFVGEDGRQRLVRWIPRELFSVYSRKYRSMVEDAVESGIANPHNMALSRFKALSPKTDYIDHPQFQEFADTGKAKAIRLISAIATQNDAYKPDHMDKVMLTEAFDEGERPFIDYSFSEMGAKVY